MRKYAWNVLHFLCIIMAAIIELRFFLSYSAEIYLMHWVFAIIIAILMIMLLIFIGLAFQRLKRKGDRNSVSWAILIFLILIANILKF